MTSRLESWIAEIFDHPVTDPAWYHDLDLEEPPEVSPADAAQLIAATFEGAGTLLSRFSDAQLNHSFWFLVNPGNSDYMFCIKDQSVPWPLRQRVLQSFVPLFRDVMAVRCSPVMGSESEPASSALKSACYMWWDLICLIGNEEDDPELLQEVPRVLEALLAIDHVACQESAIHGLGHWAFYQREPAVSVLGRYLERADSQGLRPELVEYAEHAMTGMIL